MTFERRLLGPAHVLISSTLERDGFLCAFTERAGGESAPPFDSLNLSYFVGDHEEDVRRNRTTLVDALGIESFATAEQVHGARLVRVGWKRSGAGFREPQGRISAADALVTGSRGVALAVLTADCVPVVAACPRAGLVAIVHAGWRGLAAGILRTAIRQFEDPREVRVAVGPAIGPCHYEVGEDVALAVASGTEAGAVTDRRHGSTYLDLPGTIRSELHALGIRRVEDTGLCTACERSRFFSYRMDEITGRQSGLTMRVP